MYIFIYIYIYIYRERERETFCSLLVIFLTMNTFYKYLETSGLFWFCCTWRLPSIQPHPRNIRSNREPHSRSCCLILALLVAMLALLVAILPLLFAILSPTCPKTFRKMRSWSQHRPRQPPRCLRHLFRASQKCKKPIKT